NAEKRGYMTLALSIIGLDKKLPAVTRKEVNGLEDALYKFPKNFEQRFAAKGLTVLDVLSSDKKYEAISAKSRIKYMMTLKAFFGWCQERGYIEKSPMADVKIKSVKASIDARDPYSSK